MKWGESAQEKCQKRIPREKGQMKNREKTKCEFPRNKQEGTRSEELKIGEVGKRD